jgi:hypothetical protein
VRGIAARIAGRMPALPGISPAVSFECRNDQSRVYAPEAVCPLGSGNVDAGGALKNQRVTQNRLPTRPMATVKRYVETVKITASDYPRKNAQRVCAGKYGGRVTILMDDW